MEERLSATPNRTAIIARHRFFAKHVSTCGGGSRKAFAQSHGQSFTAPVPQAHSHISTRQRHVFLLR